MFAVSEKPALPIATNAVGRRNLRPMQPIQLRRLHLLWRRWAGKLRLTTFADRTLRHYYVWLLSHGRAEETLQLTEADASAVIQWLARQVRSKDPRRDYVAGTAGREGYPEQRRIRPYPSAWSALWGCASALGMERDDLERFIRRHYAGVGLQGLRDIQTMADLNRVLWGLKAMLRRRGTPNCAAPDRREAA